MLHTDERGRYRFTFEDRHGLKHDAVSEASLYRGHPPDFAERFRENADRGVRAGIPNVRLGRTVGREAGGLVAVLMKEVEGAGRDPQAAGEGMPTREDLREAMRWQRRQDKDLQEGW
jgi:hypothetical protein